MSDERLTAVNKLTSQYEAMISDIRNSQEVQLKQKMLEYERKAKGYEKKLVEG